MALIDISETQLSFSYLLSYYYVYKPKHFMLPSLREEGGEVKFPHPGADLILDSNHLVQFKRPSYFKTNWIKEFNNYLKPSDINPPYFRFYIKNDSPTNQLDKLILATRNGLNAEYISPIFTNDTELFKLLKNHKKHLQSYAHIDIAQFRGMSKTIGHTNKHTIIYNEESVSNGFCYCFSEPEKISASLHNNDKIYSVQNTTFPAADLLKLLRSIFFPKEIIESTTLNILEECISLQRRLLMELNIIWHFNYNISNE